MHTQFANIVLQLVNAAPTRGADAEAVTEAKKWLKAIASGQLIVSPPKAKKAKP